MARSIIQVDSISKQYQINHGHKQGYTALRDVISTRAGGLGRRLLGRSKVTKKNEQEDFWALKDVSFQVQPGDRIGIIGRNGAGKSTLLKILSRITEPTEGSISICGRVASLLEVGTGFHPELTGRENIFLNGAILGMSRAEIKNKFDEIVDFAEVEKFLDTPVKRYSSGMYVRLAFAVAAHLEPEVLIVDEVLAVGDIKFQRKCLGKMKDVSQSGRTVLFVSHQMSALEALCSRGIVLEKGTVGFSGTIGGAMQYYLGNLSSQPALNLKQRKDRNGQGRIKFTEISISNQDRHQQLCVSGSRLTISLGYEAIECVKNVRVIIGIYDSKNIPVARFDTEIAGFEIDGLSGKGTISCHTEALNVVPDRYFLNIALMAGGSMEDHVVNAGNIELVSSDYFGTGKGFESNLTRLLIRHQWNII